jgi:hypothetical protein
MTHPMVTWLEAVLTEHERIAHKAQAASDGYTWHTAGGGDLVRCEGRPILAEPDGDGFLDEHLAWHIALHDPAAVLADIATKRQVLELFCVAERHMEAPHDALFRAVQYLASTYASREDYLPEWGPR